MHWVTPAIRCCGMATSLDFYRYQRGEATVSWERAPVFSRLICLILGLGSIGVAWRLTKLGASGIEDVPPPFTLLAGLTGIALLCIAVIGRYPRPRV
jgi:hypothetical protein